MQPINLPQTPGIYKIFFNDPEKFYIGSSVHMRKRLAKHLHRLRKGDHCNVHLQRTYNKYGRDMFHFEVIEQIAPCEDLKGYLVEREQYYLDTLKPHYNILPLAYKSTSVKGKSAWNKGKPCAEETKQKLSEAKIGKPNPHIGVPSSRKGKSHSPEVRAQMIAKHRATWEAKGPEARIQAVEKRRATMAAKKAKKQ